MGGFEIAVTSGATMTRAIDLPLGRASAMRFPSLLELPRHQHPYATVAVILSGGFAGRYGLDEPECLPSTVIVEPAGEAHANHFGHIPTSVVALSLDASGLGAAVESMAGRLRFARDPFAGQIARRARAELETPDDLTPMAVESAALELLARIA